LIFSESIYFVGFINVKHLFFPVRIWQNQFAFSPNGAAAAAAVTFFVRFSGLLAV
jgi:hypothetical protein